MIVLLRLLVVVMTWEGSLCVVSPFMVICGVFAGYEDELDTCRILDFCSSIGPSPILSYNPDA